MFDDTLLFDIDKFSGYDRIETGTRANVGFQYTAQLASGAYARAVFGESYQLAGQNEYDTDFYRYGRPRHRRLGLCGRLLRPGHVLSRLLGAIALRPGDVRRQAHRSRSTSAHYGPAPVEGELCRCDLRARAWLLVSHAQEILAAGVLAITDNWSLLGNIRYDLETDQTDHRRSWACAIRMTASRCERHLSAVLHPRSGHQARRALPGELRAEISRHATKFATEANYRRVRGRQVRTRAIGDGSHVERRRALSQLASLPAKSLAARRSARPCRR